MPVVAQFCNTRRKKKTIFLVCECWGCSDSSGVSQPEEIRWSIIWWYGSEHLPDGIWVYLLSPCWCCSSNLVCHQTTELLLPRAVTPLTLQVCLANWSGLPHGNLNEEPVALLFFGKQGHGVEERRGAERSVEERQIREREWEREMRTEGQI